MLLRLTLRERQALLVVATLLLLGVIGLWVL
jgi:hypothetical protein